MSDMADGGKRFFDYDPVGKTAQYWYSDADGENFTIETVQDVEDIVELNRELYKNHEGGWKGDWHHVGNIPNVIWWELIRRGIAHDEKALKAWLNDPDNQAFRVRPGRI